MIKAKVLNSDAVLNNFKEIGSLEFINGEQKTLNIQLFETELNLRYVPPTTCIVTLTFNKSGGTTLSKVAGVLDSGDRSLRTVTLSEIETATVIGGNVQISLDILGDASEIRKGIILNAMVRIVEGAC